MDWRRNGTGSCGSPHRDLAVPVRLNHSPPQRRRHGVAAHAHLGALAEHPAIVAPVDDGARFYYVQANLAVEIDRPATATIIRERHDQIDRYIMEMLHTYPVQDLRVPGQSVTLREDLKRTVNKLLPKGKGQVRNVYITNWLMTPVGS